MNQRQIRTLLLLLGSVFLDQGSKFLAVEKLPLTGEISLFADLVQLSLVINFDGFLGILQGSPGGLKIFFLVYVVVILLCCILIWLFVYLPPSQHHFTIPIVCISAGGLSNLIDRMIHNGGVIDFVSFGPAFFRTGIFNLADLFVVAGSFALGALLINHNSPPGKWNS